MKESNRILRLENDKFQLLVNTAVDESVSKRRSGQYYPPVPVLEACVGSMPCLQVREAERDTQKLPEKGQS